MTANLNNSHDGNNNPQKRRIRKPTPETQSESFRELTQSGKRNSQKERVVDFLFFNKKPLSRREIGKEVGIEIGAMCRVIEDLLNSPSSPIVSAEQSRCPITKRPVYKYIHIRHFREWQENKMIAK